ncbi:hypothetical protein GPZ74_08565 [Burkholderia pseudomallei]|nr:hypothetical protein BOC37_18480 [Burkholderia pseudomallei]ARK66271.1 hypothetical protein BOC38_05560 [Burkholderia pseudomallei]ARK75600.1 hypothetical protein BOC39_18350 [Burkholderia pseudomallei]ARK79835.1 hypothetical protein BOC40_04925 [Burkholderia pseudomallei]ARL00883.1 hypothetical protein BOC44_03060 [Burkholderia pseudomallei]
MRAGIASRRPARSERTRPTAIAGIGIGKPGDQTLRARLSARTRRACAIAIGAPQPRRGRGMSIFGAMPDGIRSSGDAR